MISEKKRKLIFALCRELNIPEEQRRIIQYSATGKESTTEMSNSDADSVIKVLTAEKKRLLKYTPGCSPSMTAEASVKPGKHRNHLPSGDNIITLMTPDQLSKIKAMSIHLTGGYNEESMNKFTQRQYHKPLRRLTSGEAISLIETQKRMLNRKIKEGNQ